MKKISSYLLVLMVTMAAVSCQQGFKKTKSGLLYKLISDGKGQKLKKGDFIKIEYVQKIGDSLLYSSYGSFPGYAKVDSVGPIYNPAEIFPLMRKGDSVVIIELADTIQRKYGQLPPFMKKDSKIIITFKLVDVFTSQVLVEADRKNEMEKEKSREDKVMADYIAAHKINAQKTEKGTYVEIKSVGDGAAVDSGKQVHVLYTGKTFPEGKVFESNITGPHKDTLKFVVGRGAIIKGWDDGLRLFKKGGSGTLYVPAYLAYDAQPNGPSRKPFENLIFDVQVVDVTDAPKEEPHPSRQQQISPEQLKKLQEQMQQQKNQK